MSAPLLGVTGPRSRGALAFHCSWLALRRTGARVRRLQPPFRRERLAGVAGIVIGGGTHIEPTRYAQSALLQYVYDRERDEFEWRVLQEVMARRLPVLGICRGAQLLNVFCGGSLFQDLVVDLPGVQLKSSFMARRQVAIEPDSAVARVMGVREVRVNSLHRQGIDRLGQGLRVAARDADGIVQAIESADAPDHFAIGVQWHPEYLPARPAHQRLFAALAKAARGP